MTLCLGAMRDDKAILRRAEPFDAAYHSAVSETLEEWGSIPTETSASG